MKSNMTAMNMNKTELNTEGLETVAGGTPKSIPGEKRSGRKNMETALDIFQRLGDWGTGIPESLGLKQKPVDNSIVDKRLPEDWMNS